MADKFKNDVCKLPAEIRAVIDSMIDEHKSGAAILAFIKEKYAGTVPRIPSLPTLLRYVKQHKFEGENVKRRVLDEKITYQYNDGLVEIDNIIASINEDKTPKINKIRVLEGLAGKCLQRIKYLEEEEKTTLAAGKTQKFDSKSKLDNKAVEASIVRYVMEVKSILDTVNKLSKEIQEDDKTILQIIRTESQGLLELVREILLDVCPDKFDLFKEKLKLKLQERGTIIDVVLDKPKEELPQLSEAVEQVLQPALESTTGEIMPEQPELKFVEEEKPNGPNPDTKENI